jgi:hypothetical protein
MSFSLQTSAKTEDTTQAIPPNEQLAGQEAAFFMSLFFLSRDKFCNK